VARRILGSAWWARFTFNGITADGDGHDSLIGGDALSDGEREQHGKEVTWLLVEKPAASVTAARSAAR
jgi:hypothetical protein